MVVLNKEYFKEKRAEQKRKSFEILLLQNADLAYSLRENDPRWGEVVKLMDAARKIVVSMKKEV